MAFPIVPGRKRSLPMSARSVSGGAMPRPFHRRTDHAIHSVGIVRAHGTPLPGYPASGRSTR